MKKLMNNINTASTKAAVRAKLALANRRGEGQLDAAIAILISVVIGALFLAGLYSLFDSIILPRVETEITDMFSYNG